MVPDEIVDGPIRKNRQFKLLRNSPRLLLHFSDHGSQILWFQIVRIVAIHSFVNTDYFIQLLYEFAIFTKSVSQAPPTRTL